MEESDRRSLADEYLALAHAYQRAARTVAASPPFWMLVGHALELSLKAVLLATGVDEERLVFTVSHSLAGALRMAEARGFQGPGRDATLALTRALHAPHGMNAFRYPSPEFPLPGADTAAAQLADHIQRVEHWLHASHPIPRKVEK